MNFLATTSLAVAAVALSLANSQAVTRFDMNAPGSLTQVGWTAADLGTGSDGTVSIVTIGLDGATVILDSRDRSGGVNDAGGGDEPAMWNDFIFASGSFDSAPGTGLQITITGLMPDTPYPITIWTFDDASPPSPAGVSRAADWSDGAGGGGTASFENEPNPELLTDYNLNFPTTSDATGQIILTGLVAAIDPSNSHNVFINGLEIGDPLFDSDGDELVDSFEALIINADETDAINTLADVLPGDDFDNDASTNLNEQTLETSPIDEDSDDDGFFDGHENNSGEWVSATMTGTDPLNDDTDGDDLLDGVENHDLAYDPGNPTMQPGSDPNLADTDGDGVRDSTEVLVDGTDPTDPDSFFDPLDGVISKFDFNAPASSVQPGWTGADLGAGTDGTISVATEAIGEVTLDSRDRTNANTDGDGADIDNNDMWRDFVFANGSFDSAPGSGLRITLSGLSPSTIYPITIWAFDESSDAGRTADWGVAGEDVQASLTFPSNPDPESLVSYMIVIEASTDATGTAVIEGIVAAEGPSTSHNVFVNGLAIGSPTGSTSILITGFDFDPDSPVNSITWTSTPGKLYAIDQTTDLTAWPVELTDDTMAHPTDAETTYEFDASGFGSRSYFRVREVPVN